MVGQGTSRYSQVQCLKDPSCAIYFWKSRCFEDIKLQKQEKYLEIMTFSRDFVVSPVSRHFWIGEVCRNRKTTKFFVVQNHSRQGEYPWIRQEGVTQYKNCLEIGKRQNRSRTHAFKILVHFFSKMNYCPTHQASAKGLVWRNQKGFLTSTKFRGSSSHFHFDHFYIVYFHSAPTLQVSLQTNPHADT